MEMKLTYIMYANNNGWTILCVVYVRLCVDIRENFWLLYCFGAYKSSAVLEIGIVCFDSEKKVRAKFMRLNQMSVYVCVCMLALLNAC